MDNRILYKQSRRWLVWATLGLLTLAVASSLWFTTIAYACQGHGAGC